MKKILIELCAVATLASCTKNEVLSYDKEAIGFDNAFVDNSTRSVVDPSFANTEEKMFDDFQVYGYVAGAPVFGADGVKVTKTVTDGNVNWTYSGVQYWIAGAIYNFSAVAPVTNGGWTKTNADKDATTLSFTNDGDTDLLYAQNPVYTAVTEGTNGTVGFTFRHVLSKVKFSFVNKYAATNSSIRVKDIKILDAYQKGSVVLNANSSTWTPTTGTNNLTLNFGNAALTVADNSATKDENDKGYAFTANNTVESYNELFMIPGAGATSYTVDSTQMNGYTVQFTVELLVDGKEIKQYTHTIYTSFVPEPGKAYDLKAEITPESIDPEHQQEEIKFTVTTITDWDNDHDGKESTDGTDSEDNQVDTTI
ncbi:MAG: fimbrillin family protein [Alistipes sp.]|nr:fimbrillin family protein [Alistipes sp.]